MGRYHIIAIERQFASGGKQIASQLAEKLDFAFYMDDNNKILPQNPFGRLSIRILGVLFLLIISLAPDFIVIPPQLVS